MPPFKPSVRAAGEAVRQARVYDNIGQRQLARRCDLSAGYLSRIESGAAPSVSLEVFEAVANALVRPPLLLLGLGFGDDLSWTMGALQRSSDVRHLVPDWNPEKDALVDGEVLDAEAVESLLRELFVRSRASDVLDLFGHSPTLGEIADRLAAISPDRLTAVAAFVAEQAVLSDLDRRDSNPAGQRLVGVPVEPKR